MLKINIMNRKIIILFFNFFFYCLIDFKSLPILILLVLFTYICTSFCTNEKENTTKFWTFLGVFFTISTWLIYKSIIKVLPLGLSFYSFKIISYLLDNYKGKINFQKNFINYIIYVTYFPQILAGPISKGNQIINQLENVFIFNREKWIKGIQLILSGLFLKYVIANRAAMYVNTVFNSYLSYNGLTLFIAAFLYSIQIYGDFSGYSNISIGVSNLLGIDCERNFNRPYIAKSIKEFWTRWHISLSTWLKDYIYIPLGGNRKGKIRKAINSMITFLVSGFWHGNGSGYLFWGFYHGFLNNFSFSKTNNKWKNLFFCILTFIEVTIGWIFFRLENFMEGVQFLKHMVLNFTLNYNAIVSSLLPFTNDNVSISMAIVLFMLVLIELVIELKNTQDFTESKFNLRLIFYIMSIFLLGVFGINKFIYMNF